MNTPALTAAGIAWSADPLDLDAARRDLWPRDSLRLRAGERPPAPALVAWPCSRADVALLLRWAEEEGRPVVPYGAGSGVCGGAQGVEGALVIDLKRMRRLLQVDAAAGTAHVEAGMLGQHLEDALAPLGWKTAHSPSSIHCSTVGGYVAARSAGQFSSRFGVFEDMLLAAHAETPTGPMDTGLWTPQGSEDLQAVLLGSEGGLGVITDVLVKLAPLPQRWWLRGFAFPSLEAAWSAMRQLMQSGLWPSALRLYDPVDTRVGGPANAARKAARGPSEPGVWDRLRTAVLGIPGLRRRLLEIPLSLPGFVNRMADRLGDEVLLIIGFEGEDATVEALVEAALPLLAAGRDLGAGPGEHWFAHRHDVSYKLAPLFIAGAWADTMEVATTWSRLPALYAGVRAALGEGALVMAHFSHAYPEGCSIYFSFVGSGDTAAYDAVWRKGLAAARAAGGTVTHHHGVGQLKGAAAAGEAGAALPFWRGLQRQRDPQLRLNPGRPFPADAVVRSEVPPISSAGPVWSIDAESQLAWVSGAAAVTAIAAELAAQGWALRQRPDRPIREFLLALRPGALLRPELAALGMILRLPGGERLRLGHAPRSAAGPDLRWLTLRRAELEAVELPVIPLGAPVFSGLDGGELGAERLRPLGRGGGRAWFVGPAAERLATLAGDPRPGSVLDLPCLDPCGSAS